MIKLIGKTTAAISILAFLNACSSGYRRPESIEAKIARYETNQIKINKVPDLQVLSGPIPTQKKTRSRAPASVGKKRVLANFSNKRLYFLALLSQYNKLQNFVEGGTPPQVNICPSFHTSLVNHNEKIVTQNIEKKLIIGFDHTEKNLWDSNYVALYPELSLPLTSDNAYPRVVDMLRKTDEKSEAPKTLVSKALQIHLTKTYRELSELCESGSSDNYYTYENLTTQVKSQLKYGANNQSVKMLFKTTIFANQAIIYSLESHKNKIGRFPASFNQGPKYYTEILHRLKADWTKSYFKKLDGLKKTYSKQQSTLSKDVEPITRRERRKDPLIFLERTKDRRS